MIDRKPIRNLLEQRSWTGRTNRKRNGKACRASRTDYWSLSEALCDQFISERPAMSATVVQLKPGKKELNATSSARGRQGNEVYRVREHLTEIEIEKLLTALRQNRYGHRDW